MPILFCVKSCRKLFILFDNLFFLCYSIDINWKRRSKMNVIEYLKSKQLKPYEKGFGYWVTAINFYKEYEKKEHMTPISAYMIYHQLSKHYNISQSTICQSMRKTLRNANIKLSCMQFIRMADIETLI